jgi:hypothetical protein
MFFLRRGASPYVLRYQKARKRSGAYRAPNFASAKVEPEEVGTLPLAMPIALESLDEQVAADRSGDASRHVLPGIIAVLQVGRQSDGHTRCETDPWFRERADDRGSAPGGECPRARIVLHGSWG